MTRYPTSAGGSFYPTLLRSKVYAENAVFILLWLQIVPNLPFVHMASICFDLALFSTKCVTSILCTGARFSYQYPQFFFNGKMKFLYDFTKKFVES